MKKKIIIIGIAALLLAAMGFGLTYGLSRGRDTTLVGIDPSNLADGSYVGSYSNWRWSNSLVVHIADGGISGIEIEKDVFASFITNASNELFKRVIEAQNTVVDAVSGATVTSKAYLKSIEDAISKAPRTDLGRVEISLDYERISGSASNQYAIWFEDMDGNLVRSLYASKWTADGGYRTRPDSIPIWVEKAGLSSMDPAEVDAVSGATPRTGAQLHTWNLLDDNGHPVPPGLYRYFLEGTLRWKNQVLFTGIIDTSGGNATVYADAEYTYEASDRFGALTEDSTENAMITSVVAVFFPVH